MDIEKLKFPIGKYTPVSNPNKAQLQQWINNIALFPSEVDNLIRDIAPEKLSWRYRPQGWMVKQVIHHCADSHMNSLIRFKLALTEDAPIIRPYYEDRWAELEDSKTDAIEESVMLLHGLHSKWTRLLKSLTTEQLEMVFIHPENGDEMKLVDNIGMYSWHCNHHLAHMKNALQSNGQYT